MDKKETCTYLRKASFYQGPLSGVTISYFWLRGKESTEVWISQNKGKESENSYQKGKSIHFPFPYFIKYY